MDLDTLGNRIIKGTLLAFVGRDLSLVVAQIGIFSTLEQTTKTLYDVGWNERTGITLDQYPRCYPRVVARSLKGKHSLIPISVGYYSTELTTRRKTCYAGDIRLKCL